MCFKYSRKSVNFRVLERTNMCLAVGRALGKVHSSKGETQVTQKGIPIFKWFSLTGSQRNAN